MAEMMSFFIVRLDSPKKIPLLPEAVNTPHSPLGSILLQHFQIPQPQKYLISIFETQTLFPESLAHLIQIFSTVPFPIFPALIDQEPRHVSILIA
jgi:hypothetical protein